MKDKLSNLLFFSILVLILVVMSGCQRYIIYKIPQWPMYLKLSNAKKGYHKIYISGKLSDLLFKNKEQKLDCIEFSDSYRDAFWEFLIVNQAQPDTLFIMSDEYRSVTMPMKSISRTSKNPHFKINGVYFQCEDGYFGCYITQGKLGPRLTTLSNGNGWEIKEIWRNCIKL